MKLIFRMSENYVRELLRVSIAQICQTIGYNAIQTTPLELLQDNLHKFLHEFCRDLRRHVDHCKFTYSKGVFSKIVTSIFAKHGIP